MPINNSYDEAAIVEAIATALDNFYTNLIKKVDSLNVKTVMKRKNPYLFRAKAMNGAAQIIDAILAAFVSSSEETGSAGLSARMLSGTKPVRPSARRTCCQPFSG